MKAWLSMLLVLDLMACSQATYPDRSSHVVDSVAVTSVLFWPSGMRYIATSETVVVELKGLQRGYACSQILESGFVFATSHDTLKIYPKVKVEIPGDPSCPLEPDGLDTALRLLPVTGSVISKIHLRTPFGVLKDTAHLVSASVYPESLSYIPDTTGKVVKGHFTFQDSTSAHPLRTLTSDSLPPCETLQSAVYSKNSAIVKVRFHRLVLDSAKHATLAPCLGKHRDSLNVVINRFLFPKF